MPTGRTSKVYRLGGLSMYVRVRVSKSKVILLWSKVHCEPAAAAARARQAGKKDWP